MVTLLICTRDRAESLAQTLASLALTRLPQGLDVELLVIDNGSQDETPTVVAAAPIRHMTVRYVVEPKVGLSNARNRGLAEARGDILLFTDDDVRVPTDWIIEMIAPIVSGEADAVAGSVELAGHLVRPWQTDVLKTWLVSGSPPPGDMWGANMAFSRRVLAEVPGFDIELGAGALGFGEESLFAEQLVAGGFRIANSRCTVIHHPDPKRLEESDLIRAADRRGRSHAYIQHHWHHSTPADTERYLAILLFKQWVRKFLPGKQDVPRLWKIFYAWHFGHIDYCRQLSGTPRKYKSSRAIAQASVDSDRPPVTIVIPLYNKQDTIVRALRSILAQTCATFEVIVVDDGSSDASARLAASVSDPRIRVVSQENGGPGSARNHGLRLARGEFVAFLDADDEMAPTLLETALRCLRANSNCAAFTGGYIIRKGGHDARGGRPGRPVPEGPSILSTRPTRDEAEWCIADFFGCSTVYRTEIVRSVGGYFSENGCNYAEDVWLWIQLRLNHPIYRHPEPFGIYHMDASELGIGSRRTATPIEPVFSEAERLRALCPAKMRRAFSLWLGRHAIRASYLHIQEGRPEMTRQLLAEIPETHLWPFERIRLIAKLSLPGIWHSARSLRTRIHSGQKIHVTPANIQPNDQKASCLAEILPERMVCKELPPA